MGITKDIYGKNLDFSYNKNNTNRNTSSNISYSNSNSAITSIITDTETIDLDNITTSSNNSLNNKNLMSDAEYKIYLKNLDNYYDNQIEYLNSILEGTSTTRGLNEIYEEMDAFIKKEEKKNNILIATMELSYLRYKNRTNDKDEIDEIHKKELDKKVQETFSSMGINSYDELLETKNLVEQQIAEINYAIDMSGSNKESSKYDNLRLLKDYNEYEVKDIDKSLLSSLDEDSSMYDTNTSLYGLAMPDNASKGKVYSYANYVKLHSDVSPLEYIKMVEAKNPNGMYTINGIAYYEELKTIIDIKDKVPDLEKTYSYLYSKNPSEALDYIEKCSYEIHNIEGQVEAEEFLKTLGEKDGDKDRLDAVANEIGVSLEGLLDGYESFQSGTIYSVEALLTWLGVTEENRATSVEEYKKMYILQGLLSQEQKESAGLIVRTENGNYINSDANLFIDYSRDFSGALLSNNYEISQGVGNMAPSVAMSSLCPVLGSVAMGVSAGGSSYHSAMTEGQSFGSSVWYGIFNGASEAITEKLLGGIPGLSDVEVTSLKTYLRAARNEGIEESVQGVMDSVYRSIFMGDKLPDTAEGWAEYAKDIGKQGLYGSITAGILQSPNLASVEVSNINTKIENKVNETPNVNNFRLAYDLQFFGNGKKTSIVDKAKSKIGTIKENFSNKKHKSTSNSNVDTKGLPKGLKEIADDWFSDINISKDVVNSIESIMSNDNYYYGIHRTPSELTGTSIYENGLILTGDISSGAISDRIDLGNNISFREGNSKWDFVQLLRDVITAGRYKNSIDGNGSAMIIKIPKDALNMKHVTEVDIVDSNILYSNGRETFLKPEYIVGKVDVDYNGNTYASGNTLFKESNVNLSDSYVEAIHKKYEELMNVKSSEEYKTYMNNKENGVVQGSIMMYDLLEPEINSIASVLSKYAKDVKTIVQNVEEKTNTSNLKLGYNLQFFGNGNLNLAEQSNSSTINVKEAQNNTQDNSLDTSIDINKKNVIKNQIEENIDFDNYSNLVSDIINITEENLPKGYTSVDEYKKDFTNILVNDYFQKLGNDFGKYTAELQKDPIMFEELTNSEMGTVFLNMFFKKYLVNGQDMQWIRNDIANNISNVNPDAINNYFNNPEMKDFINNMDIDTFISVIKEHSKFNKTTWLNIETFVDKICSLSTKDFYKVYNEIRLSGMNIEEHLKAHQDGISFQDKILKAVIEKHFNDNTKIEYVTPSLTNVASIMSIVGYQSSYQNENSKLLIDQIYNTKKRLESDLAKKFQELSDVELTVNGEDVYADNFPEYYNKITYKIGEEEETIIYSSKSSNLYIKNILNNKNIIESVLDGSFRLLKIEPDYAMSNLYVPKEKAVEMFNNGLNEVSINVNGEEQRFFVNYRGYDVDLNEYTDKDLDLKSASINSVKNLQDYNRRVEEDGFYKITYEIDGKKEKSIIKPRESLSLMSNDKILNINEFIEKNNLLGIENVDTSKINNDELMTELKVIEDKVSNTDLLSEKKYGGNQQDVYDLLSKILANDSLDNIEKSKAEVLVNLLDKYFPNSSENEKLALAANYTNNGCGYMANANAFITYIDGIKNGSRIFKEKFGFDLYNVDEDGNKVYNVEQLAFDVYLNYANNTIKNNNIKEFVSNSCNGTSLSIYDDVFVDYYHNKGIDFEYDSLIFLGPDIKNGLREQMIMNLLDNKDKINVISSANFDLENAYEVGMKNISDLALSNASAVGKIMKDIGDHAMLVTGVSDDLNIYVSSWGEKYKYLIDNFVNKNTEKRLVMLNLSFSLEENIDSSLNTEKQNEASKIEKESVNDISSEVQQPIKQKILELLDGKYGTKLKENESINISKLSEESVLSSELLTNILNEIHSTADVMLESEKIKNSSKKEMIEKIKQLKYDPDEMTGEYNIPKTEEEYDTLLSQLIRDINVLNIAEDVLVNKSRKLETINGIDNSLKYIDKNTLNNNQKEKLNSILEELNIYKTNTNSSDVDSIIEEYNTLANEIWMDYLKNPNNKIIHIGDVNEDYTGKVLSTSLITENEAATFTPRGEGVGIIVSPKTILSANSEDLKINNYSDFEKNQLNDIPFVKLPNQIEQEIIEKTINKTGENFEYNNLNDPIYSEIAVKDYDIDGYVMVGYGDKSQTNEYINLKNKADQDGLKFEYIDINSLKDNYNRKSTVKKQIEENLESDNLVGFLDTIRQYNVNDIPNGYTSVEEYHKDIANILINEYFPSLGEDAIRYVGSLIPSTTMYTELIDSEVGTNYLNNFYKTYLVDGLNKKAARQFIAFSIQQMSVDKINESFNTPEMKECINNMDTDTFISIVKEFDDYSATTWLNIETFVDKLCSMNTNDFYKVYSSIKFDLYKFLKAHKDSNYQEKILKTVIDKHYNDNTKYEYVNEEETNTRIVYKILGTAANYSEPRLKELFSNIKNTENRLKNEFLNKAQQLSDVKLEVEKHSYDNDYGIYAKSYPEHYNEITYKIGDVEKTMEVTSSHNNISLEFGLSKKEIAKAILNDNFRILKIEPNYGKSALYIPKEKAVEMFNDGLNEVSLNINGEEKKVIFNYNKYGVELKVDLNEYLDESIEVNTASINSIRKLDDYTMKVEDNDIYKISYEINGEKEESYITVTQKNSSSEKILDVNKYIEENQLAGIDNIKVSKVDEKEMIKSLNKSIEDKYSKTDLLNDKKYGGNQSDVHDLVEKYLKKENLTNIEKTKGEILNNLVDKYFPEATDIDKINLAESYTNSGCGYMANANAFVAYVEGLENGANIFKEKFGFDLYNVDESGTKVYNTEEIAFNIYLDYAKRSIGEENLNDFVNRFEPETNNINYDKMYAKFYESIGIKMKTKNYNLDDKMNNLRNQIMCLISKNRNDFIVLGSGSFDLESINAIDTSNNADKALENATIDGNIMKDIGGHAMLVTGISDDLDIYVSSWSEKYKYLIDNFINKDGYKFVKIRGIAFSLE